MNVLVYHLIRYVGWPGVLSNRDGRVHMHRAGITWLNLKLGIPGTILLRRDHPRRTLTVGVVGAPGLGIGNVARYRLEVNRRWRWVGGWGMWRGVGCVGIVVPSALGR